MYFVKQKKRKFKQGNDANIEWCINYFLQNNKHAITQIYQNKKTKKFYGIARIEEPNGKIKTYEPKLYNDCLNIKHGQDWIII